MNTVECSAEVMPGISPAVYDARDFTAIAKIVHDVAGIVLPPGKSMLVYSRIAPLVQESGCGTFSAYIARATQDTATRDRIVGAMTTNHTFFYREAHHFRHFAETVRPRLLRGMKAGRPARMWTAGCSSGEETWSLVTTLLGEDRAVGQRIADGDIRVLASDIAPHALAKATAAQYDAADLAAVPVALRNNWVTTTKEIATIADEARRLVRFRSLNLLGAWPMQQQFQVIFCRNVVIYFDLPTKEALIARFAEQLVPGGYLYIGHSERATGPAADMLDAVGPTIYRRRA